MNTLAATAETFASRLSHVSVTLLVVAVTLHVAGLLLRATAWWSVLSAAVPSRRAPWRGVTGAYLAGTGVNNVIPARGGDVARVVLASRAVPDACCPTIASSLLVETLLDTLIGAGLIVWAVSTGALPFGLLSPQLPGGSWTLIAAALAVPVGSVTTLVPLTPGGVGTQQALLALLLAPYASPAAAISYGLGSQLVITTVNVALGGTCLGVMLGTMPWRAQARLAAVQAVPAPAPAPVAATVPVAVAAAPVE